MTEEIKQEKASKTAAPETITVPKEQLDAYIAQMRQNITNEVLTSVQNQVTLIQIRAQAIDLAIKSGAGKDSSEKLSERADKIYYWLINQPRPKQE